MLANKQNTFKEINYESKTFSKAHVREVQDNQAQGQSNGNLRKSQAQAEAGLIPEYLTKGLID